MRRRPEDFIGFPLLYEDRDVLVVDKPAGLLTTRTRAREDDTAEERLNAYVRKGQAKSRKRVWLVHRLDRETSGVMLFAKSEAVSDYFRANWNELTDKTYRARVVGALDKSNGVFESFLLDDERTMKVRSVADPKRGKLARTEWRRLGVEDGTTLVEVSLKSGRKNQIRVQFSEAGHPVVGDVKYGGPEASRLYLHAQRLSFRHPRENAVLAFESTTCPPGLRTPDERLQRSKGERA